MNVDIKNIGDLFGKKTEELFLSNLESLVRKKAGPQLISSIMAKFDEFASYFNEEDPTSPVHWRRELEDKLKSELDEMSVENGRLILNLGEKSFLGYDRYEPESTEPIIWMVYFLEGLSGEYAFIDEETFKAQRGGSADFSRFGRFGKGFLIPRDIYEREGWSMIKSFEEARFPSSMPNDFFRAAADEFKLDPEIIKEALVAALEGRQI